MLAAGNDALTGGPGADKLKCEAGSDTANADAKDTVAKDCEKVKGLPPPPVVSIGDVLGAEGNAGTTTLTFLVSLSKPPSSP